MGLVSTLAELREEWRDAAHQWGVRPADKTRPYRCDEFLPDAPVECWRSVGVDAPPALVYRWLCQLRVAPYSYDWLDNFGRRSPEALIPGLAALEVGQRFMTVFRLVDFEPGASITLQIDRARWAFGDAVVTYRADPAGEGTRLLAKLRITPPRGPHGWVLRRLYEPGDFVMMRKQFMTLKRLAEATASSYAALPWTGATPDEEPPRTSLLPPPDWDARDGRRRGERSRGPRGHAG